MKRVLIVIAAILLGAAGWYTLAPRRVPAGQAPLAAMNLDELRAEFNRTSDRARLIVLLSPT